MDANLIRDIVYMAVGLACIWGLLVAPRLYARFRRRMIVRRLQAIHNEFKTLWEFDDEADPDDLPDPRILMQREKELELEAEQLLLKLGLDPDKCMKRYQTKPLR